jgi:hypothetical protein
MVFRICPGQELAESNVFLAVVTSLFLFKISIAEEDKLPDSLLFLPGIVR